MDQEDARALIAAAVENASGTWADFGAGSGTFTRALQSLLAPGSTIYAIDRDGSAISKLERIGAGVVPILADFTKDWSLPAGTPPLDGMLLANALHFTPNATVVLGNLGKRLKQGGRVVIVEYDRRQANPWVPYPITSTDWPEIACAAGLVSPAVVARRKSEYAGELYAAVAQRE